MCNPLYGLFHTLIDVIGFHMLSTSFRDTCANHLDEFIKSTASKDLSLPECQCHTTGSKSQYKCTGDQPQLDVYTLNTSNYLIKVPYSNVQDYLLKTEHFYKTDRYKIESK